MRRLALATLIIFGCATSMMLSASHDAAASHPYPKSYLWSDLQMGGDGRVTYGFCGTGGPNEANWGPGVDAWDDALGPTIEFDQAVTCGNFPDTQVKFQWESANECLPNEIACWRSYYPIDMGSYFKLQAAYIYFDNDLYPPLSNNWEKFAVEHEWGHNLSLDHHTNAGPCTLFTVMAYVIGPDPATCGMTSPSAADLASVRCKVYTRCSHEPPAAASFAANRLNVFVRGANGGIYYKHWNGASWVPSSGWSPLGGCATSAPAAASWGANRLDVFVRGCDGGFGFWHRYSTNGGATWSSTWVEKRPEACLLGAPAAAAWGVNRLDVFIRGCDNQLWHSSSTNGGASFSVFGSNAGGCLSSDPGIESWAVNRLDAFVGGCGSAGMFHNPSANGGSSWGGWNEPQPPGCITGPPAPTSRSVNLLDVFVRGCAYDLFKNSWNGSQWSGFGAGLGGCLASPPGAEELGAHSLDVFVRGCDDGLWWFQWNGGAWSASRIDAWP